MTNATENAIELRVARRREKEIKKLTKDSTSEDIEKILKSCVDLSPLIIEDIYKEIKKKTGKSIEVLKKTFLLFAKKQELWEPIIKNDSSSANNRFLNRFPIGSHKGTYSLAESNLKNKELLRLILKELDKYHVGDCREKLLLFLGTVGSLLPKQYRKGIKIGGDSSIGKDNVVTTILRYIPQEYYIKVSQSSDKYFQRQLEDLPPIIYFSEVNLRQKGGANHNIVELLKALLEDGMTYGYLEKKGEEYIPKSLKTERKTCLYSTTDVGGDEELLNRILVITLKSGEKETRDIIKDTAEKNADIEFLLKSNKEEHNWIMFAVSLLERPVSVQIPYLKDIVKYVDTGQLRARRDFKTLKNVIAWITFLHQKQRKWKNKNNKKILISEPQDMYYALEILGNQLNQSYHGLEPRLKKVIEEIKSQETEENKGWVLQSDVKKKLKFRKKIYWQVFSELSNLNIIDKRPYPDNKTMNEVKIISEGEAPFITDKPLKIFEDIRGDKKMIDGNLWEPMGTNQGTNPEDKKTIAEEPKTPEKEGIGSLGSISREEEEITISELPGISQQAMTCEFCGEFKPIKWRVKSAKAVNLACSDCKAEEEKRVKVL